MVGTRGKGRRRGVLVRAAAVGCAGLALVTSGASAADAAARTRTYHVEGYFHTQADGTVRATGDFVGTYTLDKEKVTKTWVFGRTTLKLVEGEDTMAGCIDLQHDGRCGRKDPKGSITMAYKRVATFETGSGAFVESACTHPVLAHTGQFRNGLLFMTDITQRSGKIVSDYRGTITVAR